MDFHQQPHSQPGFPESCESGGGEREVPATEHLRLSPSFLLPYSSSELLYAPLGPEPLCIFSHPSLTRLCLWPWHWVFGTAKVRGLNTDSNDDDPSLGYNGKFVPSHLHSMVSISKSIKWDLWVPQGQVCVSGNSLVGWMGQLSKGGFSLRDKRGSRVQRHHEQDNKPGFQNETLKQRI